MSEVLSIGLDFILCSALLAGFYMLLFRNKASFRACRLFLLSIPALSLLLAVANIPVPTPWAQAEAVHAPAPDTEILSPSPEAGYDAVTMPVTVYANGTDSIFTPEVVIPIAAVCLYIFVMILFQGRMIGHFSRLLRIRSRAHRQRLSDCTLYRSNEVASPFSVLRGIYVSDDCPEGKLSIILAHERQHILHRHYIDMVMIETMTVLFWFNPVIWLLRRELRATHEFEADASILSSGIDRQLYMLTILEETAGSIPVMANGFNNSLIKKRFLKMKNGNHIKHRVMRMLAIAPFMASLAVLFSFTAVPASRIQERTPSQQSGTAVASLSATYQQGEPGKPGEPNWDYRAANLTYRDGKYYNPDGIELSEGSVRSAKRYRSKYLSRNDVNVIPGKHSDKPSHLIAVEANRHETRLTFRVEIYWPSNWLFIDRGACLIDPKTGDKYMIRDIEGGQEVGVMNVVMGMEGMFVEQTLIFPPLKRKVEVVDFFEPDNYNDLPDNGTNAGGTYIRNIRLADYKPKKGEIIR